LAADIPLFSARALRWLPWGDTWEAWAAAQGGGTRW